LLGQAGNRKDGDIQELVQAAVRYRPDLVVVKEKVGQLRGRQPGEVPRVIRAELQRLQFPDESVAEAEDEVAAARHALAWARPGDVLALPLHSSAARAVVIDLLQA
jgi:cyanophycin synthetase